MKRINVQSLNECFNVSGPDYLYIDTLRVKEKVPGLWLGRKHTEESKALMRKPRRPRTKEHRENLSKAFTGRKYSEEYKENMRRVKNNTAYRITYDDGRVELIQGLSAFARENNYNRINLQYVSSGRQKYHKDIVNVEKLNNPQYQEVR